MNFSHLFQPVPARDWLIISALFLGIFTLIGISEALRRCLKWPEEFTRKLVHILVGVLTCFAPLLLETALPMILIGASFALFNLVALRKGFLMGMHGARKSYGTFFYPLSFLILVLLCWPHQKIIIAAAMAVLGLGDAAAAIVGESLRRPTEYVLIRDRKTLAGSLAMFLVSTASIFLVFYLYPFKSGVAVQSPLKALWIALVAAILSTAAEALSNKGSDNLSIPLTGALVMYFMLTHSAPQNWQFTAGMILGGLMAALSLRFGFLNASGAVAAFLLATVIFGFGGWPWTVPILAFFIPSSLLSRVGRTAKRPLELLFEKDSRRDYAQVLANGGVAGGLMILDMFFELPQLYIFYLAALAAATADTWATEIGTLARQQPRLVTTLRTVPAGTSGGITPLGLLSAFGGALLIAISGWLFFPQSFSLTNLYPVIVISLSGAAGSLVDSYLGATVQIQYRCPACQKITEKSHHCPGHTTTAISGFHWIDNDMVNFFNTLSALLFAALGMAVFHH